MGKWVEAAEADFDTLFQVTTTSDDVIDDDDDDDDDTLTLCDDDLTECNDDMLLEELGAEDGGSDTEQPTASKHPL
jgi:hypothetical protein